MISLRRWLVAFISIIFKLRRVHRNWFTNFHFASFVWGCRFQDCNSWTVVSLWWLLLFNAEGILRVSFVSVRGNFNTRAIRLLSGNISLGDLSPSSEIDGRKWGLICISILSKFRVFALRNKFSTFNPLIRVRAKIKNSFKAYLIGNNSSILFWPLREHWRNLPSLIFIFGDISIFLEFFHRMNSYRFKLQWLSWLLTVMELSWRLGVILAYYFISHIVMWQRLHKGWGDFTAWRRDRPISSSENLFHIRNLSIFNLVSGQLRGLERLPHQPGGLSWPLSLIQASRHRWSRLHIQYLLRTHFRHSFSSVSNLRKKLRAV